MRAAGTRRRLVPWVTVAVLVGLSVASGITAAASRSHAPPYQGGISFGGYYTLSPVTQISAQWKVPKILSRSPKGSACTWIGAQLTGTAFIQLGTCEDSFAATAPYYEAFWSDQAVGYHAQYLGPELAGDIVSARMRQTQHGWVLTIKDTTSNPYLNRTIRTSYGAGVRFDEAEWIQEDPGLSLNAPEFETYPLTSSVAFRMLRLNMHPPQLSFEDRSALIAADGIFLVPTAVHNDGFTLAKPSGQAARFLTDLNEFIVTSRPSQIQFSKLVHAAHPTEDTDVQPLITANEILASKLSKQTWSRSPLEAIRSLTIGIQSELNAIQQWKEAGLHNYGSAWSSLQIENTRVTELLLTACTAFDLPPL